MMIKIITLVLLGNSVYSDNQSTTSNFSYPSVEILGYGTNPGFSYVLHLYQSPRRLVLDTYGDTHKQFASMIGAPRIFRPIPGQDEDEIILMDIFSRRCVYGANDVYVDYNRYFGTALVVVDLRILSPGPMITERFTVILGQINDSGNQRSLAQYYDTSGRYELVINENPRQFILKKYMKDDFLKFTNYMGSTTEFNSTLDKNDVLARIDLFSHTYVSNSMSIIELNHNQTDVIKIRCEVRFFDPLTRNRVIEYFETELHSVNE